MHVLEMEVAMAYTYSDNYSDLWVLNILAIYSSL